MEGVGGRDAWDLGRGERSPMKAGARWPLSAWGPGQHKAEWGAVVSGGVVTFFTRVETLRVPCAPALSSWEDHGSSGRTPRAGGSAGLPGR